MERRNSAIAEGPHDTICRLKVEITHVTCHMTFPNVWKLERFQTAKATFKVIGINAIR